MAKLRFLGAAVAAAVLAAPATAQAAPPLLTTIQESMSAYVGQPAYFKAHGTNPDAPGVVTLSWVFDDGATAAGEMVSHVWTVPGPHTATVTATDAEGEVSQHVFTAQILESPFGGPVTPLPPPPPPEAGLADGKLKLSRSGTVAVRIDCAPYGDCSGTVELAARGRKLGKAAFELAPAETGTAKVRLSKANRKRLRKRRSQRVTVTVTLTGQAPVAVTKTLRTR
jgi:PKD domain